MFIVSILDRWNPGLTGPHCKDISSHMDTNNIKTNYFYFIVILNSHRYTQCWRIVFLYLRNTANLRRPIKRLTYCSFILPCNIFFSNSSFRVLIHWRGVRHTSVSKIIHCWFRWWLVTFSTPSHYLNQCWVSVNWILRNVCQWNINKKTKLSWRKLF